MVDSCAIIGAGPAGVSTAESLRTHGFNGRLILMSAERHPPYYRPALSKEALLDDRCTDPLPLRGSDFYRNQGIELRLDTTATRLAPDEGQVRLAGGETISTDTFVIATGSSPRHLSLPGHELPGVLVLRTADDAAAVRDRLADAHHVVIVGGGFIGAEVAAAATARGHPTTMIESEDLPMGGTLGRDVAGELLAAHRRRGVDVRTNTSVARFEGQEHVTGVRLDNGHALLADLVVVGIGARPNTELADDAAIDTADGIPTDVAGRTSHPAVFAAGDVAAVQQPAGTHVRTEHWQQAQHAGEAVARAILGLPVVAMPPPWFWSDQLDLNVQLAGQPEATDARSWRGNSESESFSILYHRKGRLTGVIAINRAQDVRPSIEMIKRATPVIHDQLADTSTPLKKLLKSTTQ